MSVVGPHTPARTRTRAAVLPLVVRDEGYAEEQRSLRLCGLDDVTVEESRWREAVEARDRFEERV